MIEDKQEFQEYVKVLLHREFGVRDYTKREKFYCKARACMQYSLLNEAAQYFDKALGDKTEVHELYSRIHTQRAILRNLVNSNDRPVDDLNRAVCFDSENILARYLRTQFDNKLEEYKHIQADIRFLNKIDPKTITSTNDATVLALHALKNLNQVTKAVDYLRMALSLDPNNEEALFLLCRMHIVDGNEAGADAVIALLEAGKRFPDPMSGTKSVGLSNKSVSYVPNHYTQFSRRLLQGQPLSMQEISFSFLMAGEYQLAMQNANLMIEIGLNNSVEYFIRALCYHHLHSDVKKLKGADIQAKRDIEQALKLNPNYFIALDARVRMFEVSTEDYAKKLMQPSQAVCEIKPSDYIKLVKVGVLDALKEKYNHNTDLLKTIHDDLTAKLDTYSTIKEITTKNLHQFFASQLLSWLDDERVRKLDLRAVLMGVIGALLTLCTLGLAHLNKNFRPTFFSSSTQFTVFKLATDSLPQAILTLSG